MVCWCGAPSLTRGRICRLQLLLAFASAVIQGPSPAKLITIFYCLRFGTRPTWRARSQYLYPLGTVWPSCTLRHWVHYHILLSQIRDSPNCRARSPYLYPPGIGWPSYTQRNGFPFRRLLRLAGLRWRYSNQPPRGRLTETKSKLHYDRRSVGH
jgi:hypothetical protein